jgi:hypothetical protein
MYSAIAEVADDAGARGEARARFLVDFDRPATRREVGPVDGTFRGGPLAASLPPEESRQRFEAEYPIALLRVAANASSLLPGPGSVRVQVLHGGSVVGEMVTGEDAGLALLDLPPGEYVLRVVPEAGQEVRYQASARLTFRLPVPPALRDG